VFPIVIPPLRERTGDIPALVQYFIENKAKGLKLGYTPKLAPGEIEDLIEYPWPGNVRELENVIERAMILCQDELLQFNLNHQPQKHVNCVKTGKKTKEFQTLDTVIKNHIRHALDHAKGKIHGPGGAGELLGINPNTLRGRMRKLGIPFGMDD
jgi:transcriptional regulator with PAS, ATPase and Fis domain